MTDPSLIADLVRTGIDPELVGRVVNALMAAATNSTGIPVDKTAEKRRAYDRERKRPKPVSTGNSTGIPPESEIALSSSSSPNTQVVIQEEGKKERAKRKIGTQLPPEWQPSESHYAEGAALGHGRDEVESKAEEMRLWARANGHRAVARKLDWDATFSGWMRRDRNGSQNGQHRQTGSERTGKSGFSGIALQRARAAGFNG